MNYIAVPGLRRERGQIIKEATNEINADNIIKCVSEYYNIPVDNICKVSRKRELVLARQMSMWIMRRLTPMTLLQIGLVFGKDHTTAIHGINTINDLMVNEERLKIEAEIIMNKL